jgi:hypothetical protein
MYIKVHRQPLKKEVTRFPLIEKKKEEKKCKIRQKKTNKKCRMIKSTKIK